MLEIQTIPKHDANAEGYDATGSALRMIPNSSDLTSLSALYEAELQSESRAGAGNRVLPVSLLCFPASLIPGLQPDLPDNLDFGDAGESSINKVCIVCEDDAIRNTYMVVWNFYYAGTKSARMNDGRWD